MVRTMPRFTITTGHGMTARGGTTTLRPSSLCQADGGAAGGDGTAVTGIRHGVTTRMRGIRTTDRSTPAMRL